MPHGVHTAVKEEETTGLDAVVDLVRREAGPPQLCPRDDPVLLAGEARDRCMLT